MLDFMIVARPRSRTTWLANWLTTGEILCLHDALIEYSMQELDSLYPERMLGLSDTTLGLLPDWVNAHSARKLIVHRDVAEVEQSLGMPCPEMQLYDIQGMHVHFNELDDRAKDIWEYLTQTEFDAVRFNLLKDMEVQPHFDGMEIPAQDKIKRYINAVFSAA